MRKLFPIVLVLVLLLVIGAETRAGSQARAGLPYKVYVALLTQASEADPAAVVLGIPTIPGIITFTRNGLGSYRMNSDANPFGDPTKITVIISGGEFNSFTWLADDASRILITTNSNGSAADNLLQNSTLEVRVYP